MTILQCSYTENQLRKGFSKSILGRRINCGYCGSFKVKRTKDNRFWCSKCRRKFSLTSLTFLRGAKLPLKKIYLLLDCWLRELPVKQTLELTRISRQTVANYFRKFRINAPEIDERFSGLIVMDDSCFGGRRKGKRGRGAAGKTLFVGFLEKDERNDTSRVKTFKLNDMSFKPIAALINFNTDRKSSKYYSDDYPSYKIASSWLKTKSVFIDHSVRFKETNPIENVWLVFKNKIRRMYHHATGRYMEEYVRELTYRFNTRENPDDPFSFLQKTLQLNRATASCR